MRLGVIDTDIYGNEKLLQGERVIGQVRYNWSFLIRPTIFSLALLLVPIFWYWLASSLLHLSMHHTFLWIVLILALVIPLFVFLKHYIQYRFNGMLITNRRIFMYDFHLFFHSGSDVIPISYVHEFSFVQDGILATFMNYGKLKVITSFHKERWLNYDHINNKNNEITKIQNFLAEFQLRESKRYEEESSQENMTSKEIPLKPAATKKKDILNVQRNIDQERKDIFQALSKK